MCWGAQEGWIAALAERWRLREVTAQYERMDKIRMSDTNAAALLERRRL
jgi:hypothetical protein